MDDEAKSKQKQQNLIIEPISEVEIGKFYSVEGKNHGINFYKNLCESIIVNEKQGSIYFLQQEPKKVSSTMQKFVLKKLNYDQVGLQKPEDIINSNEFLRDDLAELRNLKHKVLTFGTNELHHEKINYLD